MPVITYHPHLTLARAVANDARGCSHWNETAEDFRARGVLVDEHAVEIDGESYDRHTTHVGMVLADIEHNGYDDSDFCAVVWTGEGTREVCYGTTRYGYPRGNGAIVDATPEVRAEYDAWREGLRRGRAFAEAEAEAARPRVGSRVVVTRGRKVAKGTRGVVMWVGTARYGASVRTRVGIATSDRRDTSGRYADVVWTDASNVDVVA